MSQMEGILLIDKPAGFTSFDVVAKLRGILKTKKIGHAGTLDPMATGVLPIFVGKATKAISFLEHHEKRYTAEFCLGIETDTQDSTGKVLLRRDASAVRKDKVVTVLAGFIGEQTQIPPMFSAVKVDGKRLYELARAGKVVERQPRNIVIKSLSLLSSDEKKGVYRIDVCCSAGTYIRTLCHDVGQELHVGAVLTELVRTEACGYTLLDCHTLEQIEAFMKAGDFSFLKKTETAFAHLPHVVVTEEISKRYLNGQKIKNTDFFEAHAMPAQNPFAVFCGTDFLGLAKCEQNIVRCVKIMKER